MADDERTLEFEIEVAGTPEEVWRAIATGPGISSWYVPHEVEEREGGVASASFGPEPEMTIPGRVAAWDPPHRIMFDGGEGVDGLAFEWLVEARDGGSCVVRLVNSGFGTGEEWDDQYEGLGFGWPLFLRNLQLHCEHFAGQTATSVQPSGRFPGPRDAAWDRLCGQLGLATAPALGEELTASAGADGPTLSGTVVDVAPWGTALLLEAPAPGTAFIAVERVGSRSEDVMVSVWSYLYGDDGAAAAARDEPRWRAWFAAQAPADG